MLCVIDYGTNLRQEGDSPMSTELRNYYKYFFLEGLHNGMHPILLG